MQKIIWLDNQAHGHFQAIAREKGFVLTRPKAFNSLFLTGVGSIYQLTQQDALECLDFIQTHGTQAIAVVIGHNLGTGNFLAYACKDLGFVEKTYITWTFAPQEEQTHPYRKHNSAKFFTTRTNFFDRLEEHLGSPSIF